MQNLNQPYPADLPSTAKLLKSTGVAVVIASALLVTVVLPAEYGVDPTRIGSVFGLTEMGRIKRQLAVEAAAEAASTAAVVTSTRNAPALLAAAPVGSPDTATQEPPTSAKTAAVPPAVTTQTAAAATTTNGASAGRSHRTSLTLEPDEGAEIKMAMGDGAKANFTWSTSGPAVNYDTHGDGQGITYHGYSKGTSARETGVLTAAFAGHHGWFWRNRSGERVTITLQTSGDYESVDFVD